MSYRTRSLLLLVALIATSLVALRAFLGRPTARAPLPSVDSEGWPASQGEPTTVDLEGRSEVELVEAEPVLAGDFLRQYWGGQWPVVEERLGESGVDPNRPVNMLPWEEAEVLLDRRIRLDEEEQAEIATANVDWPEEITPEWLAEKYGVTAEITPRLLAEVSLLGEEHNGDISRNARDWVSALDWSLHSAWLSHQARVAPLSTELHPDADAPHERAFHSTAHNVGGWTVKIDLPHEGNEHILDLIAENRRLRAQRESALRKLLKDAQSY